MINRGTTLIEILIAIFILAGAMLPIFGILSFSGGATREQRAEGVAGNLAKKMMNRLMFVVDWDDLSGLYNATNWTTVDERVVDNNSYLVTAKVRLIESSTLRVDIPRIRWHNFQDQCIGGAEGQVRGVGDFDLISTNLADASGDPNLPPQMAEIILRVQWLMASHGDYGEKYQLFLLGRRANL